MPWVQPPPEIRRRVEQQLGDPIWTDLANSWARVVHVDPDLRLTQWYRSPEEILAERARNPQAALYTQHGMGLAVDVTPTEAKRAQVVREAVKAGFSVRSYGPEPTPGATYWTRTTRRDRHLHIAALPDPAWARSPLQSYLRSILPRVISRD